MIQERVTDAVANEVCKIGQGSICCRYLAVGREGFTCLKATELKPYIDRRVQAQNMNARGDNCEGRLE